MVAAICPASCTWWVHRLARGAWPPLVSMTRWLPCSAWKTPRAPALRGAAGQKRPRIAGEREQFGQNLQAFMPDGWTRCCSTPLYHLYMIAARGRHVLGRGTPGGYAAARLPGRILQQHRAPPGAGRLAGAGGVLLARRGRPAGAPLPAPLPFGTHDFRTGRCAPRLPTSLDALQASCSIPFVLQAVHRIDGAPPRCPAGMAG